MHLTIGIEIQPAFTWEGFVYLALCLVFQQQGKALFMHTRHATRKLPQVLSHLCVFDVLRTVLYVYARDMKTDVEGLNLRKGCSVLYNISCDSYHSISTVIQPTHCTSTKHKPSGKDVHRSTFDGLVRGFMCTCNSLDYVIRCFVSSQQSVSSPNNAAHTVTHTQNDAKSKGCTCVVHQLVRHVLSRMELFSPDDNISVDMKVNDSDNNLKNTAKKYDSTTVHANDKHAIATQWNAIITRLQAALLQPSLFMRTVNKYLAYKRKHAETQTQIANFCLTLHSQPLLT